MRCYPNTHLEHNDPKKATHTHSLTHTRAHKTIAAQSFIIVFKIYITKIHINFITFVLQISLFEMKTEKKI